MKQENHSRFMMSERAEKLLKNLALILGLFSAVAVVFDLYPLTMFLSLPFCLIWIYCGWLRTEPQLKWINVVFSGLWGGHFTLFFDSF
jgi:hypothetical protein